MASVRSPLAGLWLPGAADQGILARRITLIGLMLVALVAHAFNMFQYPAQQWIPGEGTFVAQSWAVLHPGQLQAADFFAHPPAGWLLLAAWTGLTGGPHAFGTAIDSARVFMLLLHLAMIPLLFRIARKLGCGDGAAAFAVLLFSLSPLAILYQRFVLSGVMMLWWLLASLNLLLDGWHRRPRGAG